FTPAWKMLRSIDREVKARKMGSVIEVSCTQRSDWYYEIAYQFKTTDGDELPIFFNFCSHNSTRVSIKIGTAWSSKPYEFSTDQLESTRALMMSLATFWRKIDGLSHYRSRVAHKTRRRQSAGVAGALARVCGAYRADCFAMARPMVTRLS